MNSALSASQKKKKMHNVDVRDAIRMKLQCSQQTREDKLVEPKFNNKYFRIK